MAKVPLFLQFFFVDIEARKKDLEEYLRIAIESSEGDLPPALSEFLKLPPDGVEFEPLAAAPPPPVTINLGAAASEWEFSYKQITFVREIGQGGFGTVYEAKARLRKAL